MRLRIFSLALFLFLILPGISIGQTPGAGPRFSPQVEQLIDDLEQGRIPSGSPYRGKSVSGNRVTLLLESHSALASAIAKQPLRSLGAEIEAESRSYLRINIPFGAARRLAERADISVVRLATPAVEAGFGPIESESAAITGATVAHGEGATGAGIKVAVVDLGFIGLGGAIAAGELPLSTVAVDYTGLGIESNTTHGVGVAEHVLDMAPGVELHCLKVSDELDLQNAADYCAANGIAIANHSVGWVIASYYDGTGPISNIINESRTVDGVFWSISAGNDAQRHWRGGWNDSDGDDYLEFSGTDETMALTSGNSTASIFLNWDQYGNTLTDLDLYVLNKAGVAVAAGTGVQSGPSWPFEAVYFNYLSSQAPYTILVHRKSGPTSQLDITLFSFRNNFEYAIAANSMTDPASAPGAFSVAAVNQANWFSANPPTESFSSRGPTNDGRPKPELTAPDGTSSWTYGLLASYGTSFSAPTVAGAAAVLLSEDPSRTASDLESLLRGDAIDVGAPGWDPVYGEGLLDVVVAPSVDPVPLALEPVATGLAEPTFLTAPEGDGQRLYILERRGTVRVIEDGVLSSTFFLDIRDRAPVGGYISLLGMAFHPDYDVNGEVYVLYSSFEETTRTAQVSRLFTSASGPGGMVVAEASSEQILFSYDANLGSHNGGTLCFGPNDGYLYFGTGDGGGGCCYDPLMSGQDLTSVLGKILRIDVNDTDPGLEYAVPPSNPFVTDSSVPDEIWAYGVRNPFRLSFDRANGDFYIGDVGQDAREEINVQPAASLGGENYGWSVFEGTLCGTTTVECDALEPFVTFPLVELAHPDAQSITGGYVYRGAELAGWQGAYFFGDYVTRRVWSFRNNGGVAAEYQELTSALDPLAVRIESVVAISEDGVGELYVVNYEGSVFKIVPKPPNQAPSASFTSSSTDLEVQFTDTSADSDGAIVGWSWAFGDGGTSTTQDPLYQYASAGTYGVTLEVTDNDGDTDSVGPINVTVEAPNIGPTAGFTFEAVDLDVQFMDTSTDGDGFIDTWYWAFGDGETSNSQHPLHSYAFAGTYDVTLEITDNDGESDVFGPVSVEVVSPPVLSGPKFHADVISNVTNTAWTTVSLPNNYTKMVVVCTPLYTGSGAPRTVRVRNALGNSFDVRADRADGASGSAGGVDVHYFVVEEGVYNEVDHGVTMEAATYLSTVTDSRPSWTGESRAYANGYTNPVVLGQIQTYNDSRHTVFWSRGADRLQVASSTSLWTGKHVGEDPDSARANEMVGYVVIEAGAGTLGGRAYSASVGPQTVQGVDDGAPFVYANPMASPAVAVASQGTMAGIHGSWAILYGGNPFQGGLLNIALDEDQIADAERSHTTERVSILIVGPPVAPPQNEVPSASFDVATSQLEATFTDTSTDADGTLVAWAWDFGDGNSSTAQHPVHTYASNGTYNVTLTVTDDDGAMDTSDVAAVHVSEVVAGSGPKLHGGIVTGVTNVGWSTVSLPFSYDSMVVVCTPLYNNGDVPRTVRVRGAGGSSFDVRADRADGGGAAAPGIPVHYFVVEEGVYTQAADGITMEAVAFVSSTTDDNDSWVGEARAYANAYSQPAVFGQVMTYNDPGHTVFWSHDGTIDFPPSPSSLYVGKHAGEDPNSARSPETIGYVVIESGSGTVNGRAYECGMGSDILQGMDNAPPYVYGLSGAVDPVGAAVVTQAGMDGSHGSWAVLYGGSAVQPASLALAVDEDQLADVERAHTTERAAYLVLSAPASVGSNTPPSAGFSYVRQALSVSFIDNSTDPDGAVTEWLWDFGDGMTSVDQNPIHAYAAPGTYTVNLTVTDDDGDASIATPQTVSVTDIPGPTVNTGILGDVTNTGWTTVTLPDWYTSMIVVASPLNVGSEAPRTVRIRNATGNSFDIRADRADGVATATTPISVHYMVVEEGVYTQATHGVTMEAVRYLSTVTDSRPSWVGESRAYANGYTNPVVLGQIQTYNDSRHTVFWSQGDDRTVPASSTSLWTGKHVGEDPALTRANEIVGYIVIEAGTGTLNGQAYTAAVGPDMVQGVEDGAPFTYTYSGVSPTKAIVSQAAMGGIHGSWAILYGANPFQGGVLNLAVDEDQLADAERNHTTEPVAFILFE